MSQPDADWVERRRQAITAHAAAHRRRRAAETTQARVLIADFVREAGRRGLRITPLSARSYNGRTTYRTGLRGWYLRPDRGIAVGVDGQFYILTVAGTFRARFAGAVVAPTDPPLVVGEGARDGESMPLQALLSHRLEVGDDWH